jgi:hypothetical protein
MSFYTDWLTAIGTFGAVVTSLYFAARDSRRKRKHDERQQAEKVTAWFVPYEGEQDSPNKLYDGLRIRNASNELVYDLIAQVVGVQGSFRKTAVGDTEERNNEFGAKVGNGPPATTRHGSITAAAGCIVASGSSLPFRMLREGFGCAREMASSNG